MSQSKSEYIFFTGAPGSKWSGLVKWLYWAPEINHSDYSSEREYYRTGDEFPGHTGAYFDPGMEFELGEWDKPFSGDGIKIIKSHTIAENLDSYKDYPIVMVLRDTTKCLHWWIEAGGFDITYPNYSWYEDYRFMNQRIVAQDYGMRKFIQQNKCTKVSSLSKASELLGLSSPPCYNPIHELEYITEEIPEDIEVYVYCPPTLCK